ncbi:PDR/VanB family oxidoreductase [Cupriavidus sp. TMH.W2]|uniref:PDR/VanB family oxidoreductase n=1 Tax=Cupriavidus sp. TMH.W2 TaxID=3434465 RepID=UPI003D785C51
MSNEPNIQWPLDLVVAQTTPLTAEVRQLILRAADGGALPAFSAGAHLAVCVQPHGTGSAAQRAYSLLNSTAQSGHYEIAVKHEAHGAGGSRFMHALAPGDRLRAGMPKNDFALHAAPHHAVLIAGGIGITPILSMARWLDRAGQPFQLHYAARTPRAMPYRDEAAALGSARATLYFDHGEPSRGMPLEQILGAPAAGRHVYVCGPRPLIDAVVSAARAYHWPAENVHLELFGNTVPQAGDQPCRVVLARSGITLEVPAAQSILDAMIGAGLDPMFDCRRGECGVCAQRVLRGEPDHRDYALSTGQHEVERLMCVCVSRARGELVLDA